MSIDRHIRRDGSHYADALAGLLPRGPAWLRDQQSTLMRTVGGLAGIFGYVDSRAADLLERETDPRITLELLPDWERNWGLPDECFPSGGDMDQRHKTLVRKMTIEGGQSRKFFIDTANELGYPIRIYEFAPYMCGVSQVGDIPDDMGQARWEVGPIGMRFLWTVHEIAEALHWLRCGSGQCGIDPHLRIETSGDLECIFKRWKPAHTLIVFDYSAVNNTEYYSDIDRPEDALPPPVGEWVAVEGHGRCEALPITVTTTIGHAMLDYGLPNATDFSVTTTISQPDLSVNPQGTLAVTEEADIVLTVGSVSPVGTLHTTEASDVVSISGRMMWQATATLAAHIDIKAR